MRFSEDAGGCDVNNLDAVAKWAEVMALLLAVVVFLYELRMALSNRQKKEITKRIESIPLARIADSYTEKVEVLFDGRPVDMPHLVRIRIRNSGNVPIPSSDFAAPFTFKFGEHCEILHAEVVEKNPGNLDVSMQITTGIVQIQPDMLNPMDSFALRILGARIDRVVVDARIVGIQDIPYDRAVASSARDYVGIAFVMVALTSFALVLQSAFVWGFVAAGLLGFALQRIRLFRTRAVVGQSRLR
jgi:hypothetical protein